MRAWVGVLVAITFIANGCQRQPQVVAPDIARADPHLAADAAMIELVDEGFRGSVLVACGGEIVLNKNYGVDPGDATIVRYWVASVTKGLTAIAVLSLVERSELRLDDTLVSFFPDAPADKRNITVFNLLTHGSGLPQNYAAEGISGLESAAAAVLAQPLMHEPGAAFRYSNDGYSLLAMIIEKSSGVPYEEYVSRKIMTPLGLEDIAFRPASPRDGEYIPPLANPYESVTDGVDWGFRGGHGARLSVDEIYAITKGLLDGSLLSDQSVALLHGPHFISSSGLGVGMGWFRETDEYGRDLIWMRGSDQSGGNALSYIEEDAGLIVVSGSNAGPDRKELRGWSQAARDALIPIYAPAYPNGVRANCG